MSNVVDFPPARRERTRSAEDDCAARAERASMIREVLNANRPMVSDDQTMVAKAIWQLLDRLRGQGVSKVQVLRAAGIAHEGDSTKHLGHYALNPDRLNGSKNVTRLNKKPRKYVAILNAAATLTGTNPDDALLDVFGATSLAAPGTTRTAAPEFDELARLLREIARSVATKYGLQSYFQDVVRSGNQLLVADQTQETPWDRPAPADIALQFCKDRVNLDWPVSFHGRTRDALYHDHAQSVPPYPAVLLGEWIIGDDNNLHWDTTDDPQHLKDGECSFGGGLSCYYKAELRVCIVPVGPDLRPEPALRLKIISSLPTVSIEGEDGRRHSLTFEDLDWVPTQEPQQVRARVSSSDYLMTCRLWTDGGALPPLVEKYFPADKWNQRHACQFVPLTGAVAEDWFSLPAFDFELQDGHYSQVPAHIRVLGEPLFRNISADDFSPFQANTIAAGLDQCLSGKHGADPLDLLDARAEQFVELLRDASAFARMDRDAAMARLDARLCQMRDKKLSPN